MNEFAGLIQSIFLSDSIFRPIAFLVTFLPFICLTALLNCPSLPVRIRIATLWTL